MIRQLSVPSKVCKQIKPRKWSNLAWNSHPSELIQPVVTASLLEVMEHMADYTQCLNNRMEVPRLEIHPILKLKPISPVFGTYIGYFYIWATCLQKKKKKKKWALLERDSPDPFLYIHFALKWVTPLVSTD